MLKNNNYIEKTLESGVDRELDISDTGRTGNAAGRRLVIVSFGSLSDKREVLRQLGPPDDTNAG